MMEISYARAGLTCIPFIGFYAHLYYACSEDAAVQHLREELVRTGQETEAFQTYYENRRIYALCHCTRNLLEIACCITLVAFNILNVLVGYPFIGVLSCVACINGFDATHSKEKAKHELIFQTA